MLPRKKRLRTKDVMFLTKKRQYFWSWLFGFFYIKQYPNIKYHQCSCHISIKYSKHAVARNLLKRAIIQQAESILHTNTTTYYKIFIVLNKNKIPLLQKEVENMKNKDIIHTIQNHFQQSFTALFRHLWKSSTGSLNMGQKYWKTSTQQTKNNLMK